jgi:isopenicillin-N N-acyltransferase like protein
VKIRCIWLVLFAVALATPWCSLAEGYRTSVGSGEDEIPVIVVKGTPYEMGYAFGQLTKDEARGLLERFLGASQAEGDPRYSNENLDAAWTSISPHVHQPFKDELRGLADGAGMPLELVRRAHMLPVVGDYSCSSIAAWGKATKNGHLYQTRNLDWHLALRAHDFPCLVVYLPNEGTAHANVSFAGYVGCNTGMNAAGIVLSEMGDSPGKDYPFNLDGNHFTTMFREILYDCNSLTETINLVKKTQRIKKYHFVMGDGQEPRGVKMLAHAPNLVIWKDNDPSDEHAPKVLEGVVYQDEGRGAYEPLQKVWGKITHQDMIDIAKMIPIKGGNVLDVVYDATSLEMWIAYAEAEIEAYKRPFVHVNLKDYLKYDPTGAAATAGKPPRKGN